MPSAVVPPAFGQPPRLSGGEVERWFRRLKKVLWCSFPAGGVPPAGIGLLPKPVQIAERILCWGGNGVRAIVGRGIGCSKAPALVIARPPLKMPSGRAEAAEYRRTDKWWHFQSRPRCPPVACRPAGEEIDLSPRSLQCSSGKRLCNIPSRYQYPAFAARY